MSNNLKSYALYGYGGVTIAGRHLAIVSGKWKMKRNENMITIDTVVVGTMIVDMIGEKIQKSLRMSMIETKECSMK